MKTKNNNTETATAAPEAVETAESADQTKEEWLAIRKDAGRRIDPETADVMWEWGYTLDPYGIDPELPEELQQLGRVYFARSPGSDIWVCFYDLPSATSDALWKKHGAKLSFPHHTWYLGGQWIELCDQF